jgi:hypothetical protein
MSQRIERGDLAEQTSFGVFKPTGHSVIVYEDASEADEACRRLGDHGFAAEDVLRATSRELFPHPRDQMERASGVLAAQGYEVVLMHRYLDIARRHAEASWLVVWSPDAGDVERLKEALAGTKPHAAAHYGLLLIEDLVEPTPGGPAPELAAAQEIGSSTRIE